MKVLWRRHRCLENGEALKRGIELHSYFLFFYLKEDPPKDDRLKTILDKIGFPLHAGTPEFTLFICNEIEPFLTFFQAEWLLAAFLYEKLKELLISIMGRLLRPAVFTRNSSTWKMLKIDLKKEENLISSHNLHVGVRTTRAFNKCTTTQAPQVRKLKQNARKFYSFG